jgi:hypothetical protein
MKAGVAPIVQRSRDGHLDLLERKKAEKHGEHSSRAFGDLVARQWPLGRVEITFPDGHQERDLADLEYNQLVNAIREYPELRDAMNWAGWPLPYVSETAEA